MSALTCLLNSTLTCQVTSLVSSQEISRWLPVPVSLQQWLQILKKLE